MKVTFVGTGTMGCVKRCNTSILVDDILFDIGMGTVKQLGRLDLETKSINYLVITHFHADHFLDIPNLLIGGKEIRKEIDNKLVIIGPEGLKEKIKQLMLFTHSDGNEHKYDNMEEKYNVEFVELKSGEEYKTDKFKLKALSLKHGTCVPINGYILEKENKVLSYTGDTTLCDNFYKMCEVSDYIFADVTGMQTKPAHIGLEDYMKLYEKYPNCHFYAIHRSDYNTENIDNVKFPNDGDILTI